MVGLDLSRQLCSRASNHRKEASLKGTIIMSSLRLAMKRSLEDTAEQQDRTRGAEKKKTSKKTNTTCTPTRRDETVKHSDLPIIKKEEKDQNFGADAGEEDRYDADSPGQEYVKSRVAKYFHGVLYLGTITNHRIKIDEYNDRHDIWNVDYDDGDDEEYDKEELKDALKLYEEDGRSLDDGGGKAKASKIKMESDGNEGRMPASSSVCGQLKSVKIEGEEDAAGFGAGTDNDEESISEKAEESKASKKAAANTKHEEDTTILKTETDGELEKSEENITAFKTETDGEEESESEHAAAATLKAETDDEEESELKNTDEPVISSSKPEKKRRWKDPNAPKKAKSAYTYFMMENRPKLNYEHPHLSSSEITKLVGQAFKKLDADKKKKYEDLAKADRERYTREMEHYSPRSEPEERLVEFKFCSQQTALVDAYAWKGTIHLTMLQDPASGKYELPPGLTKFKARMKRPCFRSEFNVFEGSFRKSKIGIVFDLGMDLKLRLKPLKQQIYPRGKGNGYTQACPFKAAKADELEDAILWETSQGGTLCAYAKGRSTEYGYRSMSTTYIVKLYTVLSVHKPNEAAPAPLPEGYEPDWDFLVGVVLERFPNKDEAWSRKAVSEYRAFLDLKISHEDWNSTKFSPSIVIDEVWHAHISFIRKYQCDILYLTGGEALIEHSPVLGQDAFNRYANAYAFHKERMEENQKVVDSEFWPDPTASRASQDFVSQHGGVSSIFDNITSPDKPRRGDFDYDYSYNYNYAGNSASCG